MTIPCSPLVKYTARQMTRDINAALKAGREAQMRASATGDHAAWLAASEAAQAFQREARAKHARWEQASSEERGAAAFHEQRGRLDRKNEAARLGRTQGRDYRSVERANVAASIARVAYDDAAQAWTFGDTTALLKKTAAWDAWQAALEVASLALATYNANRPI